MKALEEFIIPFSGLKQGRHTFDFEVNDEFFSCFEESEIRRGRLNVRAELDRKSVLLVFELNANGVVWVPCDRCGDEVELEVNGAQTLVVKLGNEESEGEDDVIYLSLKDHEINIAHQVYEMIALAVPYQRVHADGRCNAEALKNISLFSPGEVNKNDSIDPRWEALKQLKDKDKKKSNKK